MDTKQEPLTATSSSMRDFMSDPRIGNIIEHLRNELHCSLQADDLDRVNEGLEKLAKFQSHKLFETILGPPKNPCPEEQEPLVMEADEGEPKTDIFSQIPSLVQSSSQDECFCDWLSDEGDEEECLRQARAMELFEEPPENAWLGYFKGYEILDPDEEFNICEIKKCIEINKDTPDDMIEGLIRAGVKCFCINLSCGTCAQNQQLLLRIREAELCISKEIGYPFTTTLMIKLSPRLQYTGYLDPSLPNSADASLLTLKKHDKVTVTIKREYSMKCSKEIIYVNAKLLMEDVHPNDILLVGSDIQLFVKSVSISELKCCVLIGGVLESRLPVLFPGRCNKFHVSVEELEDLTFCKELGINVIVSHTMGTKEYFEHLQKVLEAFQCEKMRLFARVILNDLKGCEKEFDWAADGYDGFLIEVAPPENISEADILHLCPAAETFLERAYKLQKPIIIDPGVISLQTYVVDPAHYLHIFYYPDKYLFKYTELREAFRFFCLQNAIYGPLPEQELSKLPYCDTSGIGSDSLALAAVSAAFEMHASAIFVLGFTGLMATKLAHFRPKVPIIFITQMKSASKFICLYHNVILLLQGSKSDDPLSHRSSVFKHLLFGLLFAKARKIIRHSDNIVIVYNQEAGTKFPDKYISYKFDEKYFATHLSKILFKEKNMDQANY